MKVRKVDAIKHYYDQITGKNMIHYVPYAGQNFAGGKQALSGFLGTNLRNEDYQTITRKTINTKEGVELKVTALETNFVEL